MEHNLEDSLTMMDFEHSGVEVTQEEMCLEDQSQADTMAMEMDDASDQQVVLEGGTEEVIVSDYIGDPLGYQEYSVNAEDISDANITIQENQIPSMAHNEQIMNMQLVDQSKASSSQAGVFTIKQVAPQQRIKKTFDTAPVPRQVAIAPKPAKGAPNVQYAIAPKPVAFLMNKSGGKTVAVKNVVQGLKGNTVLAQIGKQLVMVPQGVSGGKLKVASIAGTSDTNNVQVVRCTTDSSQIVTSKDVKPKLVIQGQSSSDSTYQPAVLTKIVPSSGATTQTRYIMQQKTVPIGMNKVLVATSPKKSTIQVAPKNQIISIKAEASKATSQANIPTKKIVITANPTSQLKSTNVKTRKTQGSELRYAQWHPISMPGKGVQYIKINKITTNQPAVQKPTPKPQTVTVGGKNFVLADAKGNIIDMADKTIFSSQPTSVLMAANTTSSGTVSFKGRKLVRIAPITSKTDTTTTVVTSRGQQSLLVPRDKKSKAVSLEEYNKMVKQSNVVSQSEQAAEGHEQESMDTSADSSEPADVKPTLASLISDALSGNTSMEQHEQHVHSEEVVIEYHPDTPRKPEYFSESDNTNSADNMDQHTQSQNENLIIVPSNVSEENNQSYQEEYGMNNTRLTTVSVEADVDPYMSDYDPAETVLIQDSNSTMRPRKACNCTKSQCLKLYCDCFANGEFCNQCNCNNCHNNLDHEETRHKAIRACLERNPNAFRPKIGKAKDGGPEIVRRHNKGCNCKRSGCLKNYCECYEAKIACTVTCKCVGCRNIEETVERRRDALRLRDKNESIYRPSLLYGTVKHPCTFMTREVIEAVAQCMLATAGADSADPVEDVLQEFSRCMADIISASNHDL